MGSASFWFSLDAGLGVGVVFLLPVGVGWRLFGGVDARLLGFSIKVNC